MAVLSVPGEALPAGGEAVGQNVRQPSGVNLFLRGGNVVGHTVVSHFLRVGIVDGVGRPRIAVAGLPDGPGIDHVGALRVDGHGETLAAGPRRGRGTPARV